MLGVFRSNKKKNGKVLIPTRDLKTNIMITGNIKIHPAVMPPIEVFFAFSFFNNVLIGMRGVFLAVAILAVYYFCLAIQKALLRI
ncbi:MAG: hypothetical protein UW95_C0001G0062 [Parcubacteria group bacterium GW2011_GWC1_45_14]|nr:MAG: hypothetical protein UW87_C0007G0024 [Candidatus Moranbacteria bacterium GW2011_GWC2_45_10]KKT95498.1 MAG: hypothetical protein UW95_C0001G0062 [Parcubacteria group bacterium GW2011_GWC1_45_14]